MIDLAELPTCTRCDLSLTRQRVVVGSGPLTPQLMVIGEAPGRLEDETGEPFVGRSGQLLFRLLEEEIGLRREQCFVTSVVKCRPPANRTPTRHELATCRPWLDEQLELITPRVVVTLGNTAARSVFGFSEPMRDFHGRVVNVGSVPGLATYHPAAALRGGVTVVDLMRNDFRVVRQLLATP
ncbi:MAG TPA: uracil-DNA glycosylase [Acidimicrobiales bacterium]|nr:uracil-DNA glycosylase [Acidimicrobiales bacterium]